MDGEFTPSEFSAKVLEFFGPNGENWAKGNGGNYTTTACLVTSARAFDESLQNNDAFLDSYYHWKSEVGRVIAEQFFERVERYPRDAIYSSRYQTNINYPVSLPAFNDHPDTTFEDIRLVLEKVRANG